MALPHRLNEQSRARAARQVNAESQRNLGKATRSSTHGKVRTCQLHSQRQPKLLRHAAKLVTGQTCSMRTVQ
eukprot:3557569-Amphidinium_carterae.1